MNTVSLGSLGSHEQDSTLTTPEDEEVREVMSEPETKIEQKISKLKQNQSQKEKSKKLVADLFSKPTTLPGIDGINLGNLLLYISDLNISLYYKVRNLWGCEIIF